MGKFTRSDVVTFALVFLFVSVVVWCIEFFSYTFSGGCYWKNGSITCSDEQSIRVVYWVWEIISIAVIAATAYFVSRKGLPVVTALMLSVVATYAFLYLPLILAGIG